MGESNVLGPSAEHVGLPVPGGEPSPDAEVEEGCSFQEGREARRRFWAHEGG